MVEMAKKYVPLTDADKQWQEWSLNVYNHWISCDMSAWYSVLLWIDYCMKCKTCTMIRYQHINLISALHMEREIPNWDYDMHTVKSYTLNQTSKCYTEGIYYIRVLVLLLFVGNTGSLNVTCRAASTSQFCLSTFSPCWFSSSVPWFPSSPHYPMCLNRIWPSHVWTSNRQIQAEQEQREGLPLPFSEKGSHHKKLNEYGVQLLAGVRE